MRGDGLLVPWNDVFTQVEEHLKAVHDDQGGKNAKKKRKQAFEWRCRLISIICDFDVVHDLITQDLS